MIIVSKKLVSCSQNQVDRTYGTGVVGREECYDPINDNQKSWPFPSRYTKLNCDAFQLSQLMPCSMTEYFKLRFRGTKY